MCQLERDPKHIKRQIGLANPYTRGIISNGKLHIVEITKEEYDALIEEAFERIDLEKGSHAKNR